MKTGDFISSLATITNVNLDGVDTTTEIPDEIANKIKTSLYTKESALANPDIINRLKAESLDAVDGKLKDMAKDLGLGDGFIHNLTEVKGTYNRMDSLKKAVLDAKKLALADTKGVDNSDEINKLNNELATLKESTISRSDYDIKIKEYETLVSENANRLLRLKSEGLFSHKNWAMDVSPEANLQTAINLFNSELKSKELQLVDNGQLKLQTKEGSDYFVENKTISPQDFANDLLANHKLLKVSEPQKSTTSTPMATTMDAGLMEAVNQANQLNADIQTLGVNPK